MNKNIIFLNDKNFEKNILNLKQLILFYFWAEWCGPCKMISPIIEEISNDFKKDIIIAKCNIEENKINASKYNVNCVPSFLLMKNNKVISTKIGVISKNQLKKFIKIVL